MTTGVVWFRRDLRVQDHPALSQAVAEFDQIVPVFVFDPGLLHGRYASGLRTRFMLGCLRDLDQALRERGSHLVVRVGRPEREVPELARQAGASVVTWTGDISPYARARDARVERELRGRSIAARRLEGNYVIDVSTPRTQAGEPFRVFSPFHRFWAQFPRRELHAAPTAVPPVPAAFPSGSLTACADAMGIGHDQPGAGWFTEPGESAGRAALQAWLSDGLEAYAQSTNGVPRLGSSRLSPYLRFGCLSPLELEQRASTSAGSRAGAWTRQLAWRDFYAHILLHWPENTGLEFRESLRGLEWDEDSDHLLAWQRGQTGFPLVDAAMRQLASEGWMHNRLRLVVGSFLTKDLQVDWRRGEEWFARLLLDGEPAQNNGNWQWIASVGTDPAPVYRRIYNPAAQGRTLDPDGRYTRRWVPELERVPVERLFEPWRLSPSEQEAFGCRIGRDYPAPIVDHLRERRRALDRYRRAMQAGGDRHRQGAGSR